MSASHWIHIEGCSIKRLTEKAVLIKSESHEGWIPLSVIDDPDRLEEGDEDVTLSVQEWFASKEEIEP